MKDLLDPCAWAWFGLVAMAAWQWREKKFRIAWFIAALVLIISLGEWLGISQWLIASKERIYWQAQASPAFSSSFKDAEAVVMCGGLLEISREDFSGANYEDTVDRFLKAVEVARRLQKPLVLGGGQADGKDSPLESTFEKAWLQNWGMSTLDVMDLGLCVNTHDEALAAARLARQHHWRKIVLVTSGYHMDRALGAFKKTGLQVVPVACDFRGVAQAGHELSLRPWPTTDSAERLRLYLCEEVGAVYYRCRGWI
jgi:uncharacterized SAM-binding protein YcdF (DUF218 family)